MQTVPSPDESVVDHAYKVANFAHKKQLRMYTGEPYFNHCVGVYNIVSTVTESSRIRAAALLHDIVEDTVWSIWDVYSAFGGPIAELVRDVTDVSRKELGDRAYRKEIDMHFLARAHPDAQTIKLADLIHNSKSILQYAPTFAKTYMREKRDLLAVLKFGNADLHVKASKIVDDYYAKNK